ncbi:ImmA/IrrE family metallo-endopeptidase [Paenibacillus sp. 32O-W]|uniref:ImmA/IrrE family metallo-endopeptidase n=1 Tax=Paenibacillus sp. 32O-W TaxID=1695218 RepID=UPI0016434EE8
MGRKNVHRVRGIQTPSQLNVFEIAYRLNAWLYFNDFPSKSIERNGLISISLDRRRSPPEQWEDFLHELCHVLRHAGNQMQLPGAFVDYQEWDAECFVMYAAIPYSMYQKLILPNRESEAIDIVAREFGCTHTLAERRLQQIRRRKYQFVIGL